MEPFWFIFIIVFLFLLCSVIGVLGYITVVHPAPPKVNSKKKHILFIGDSITFGNGVVPFQKKQRFSALLEPQLKEYQLLNYGLSGRTLLKEGDIPYIKESFYAESCAVPSEAIFIMLGTNDSKPYNWKGIEQYKKEYLQFIESYKKQSPNAKFVLGLCPKAHPHEKKGVVLFDIQNEVIQNEILPAIREVAEEVHAKTIDLYAITKDHPEYFQDGIHPNKKGNQVIAEALYSCFKDLI